MKMKKYEASDMKEALKLIKQDLGPDAVILSTRKVMKSNNFGLFSKPVLEVTAAVDYKGEKKQPLPQNKKTHRNIRIDDDGPYSSYSPQYVAKNRPHKYNSARKKEVQHIDKEKHIEYYDNDDNQVIRQTFGYDSYKSEPFIDEIEEKEYVELAPPPVAPRKRQKTAPRLVDNDDEYFDKYSPIEEKKDDTIEKMTALISSLGLDKLPALLEDIGDIKKQLSEMKNNMAENMAIDLPDKLREFYTIFTKNGIDEVVSYRFLKSMEKRIADNLTGIQFKNAAIDMLSELIMVEEDYSQVMSKRIIALVGPTGVGKTTTIAKIAASLTLKYNKKVCLITLDNFRIGAVEQLKTYAEIVNVPLYVATTPEELKRIIREVKNRYDCILLDSMGRSQFDINEIKKIGDFLKVDESISTCLVMSLASNHQELYDTVERYSSLLPEYFIFTKLDETRYFGPLVNLPVKKNIPILLVATGQNVPDDMEVPNGKKIAKRLLQEIPTLWSEK